MQCSSLAIFSMLIGWTTLAYAGDDPCDREGHLAAVQCFSKELVAAEAVLDGLYKNELGKLPDSDPSDIRKGKAQLVKAQAAWKLYVEEHCNLVGGLQGGSNLWVTDFAARCTLDEINQRIKFFRNFPDGG